MSAPLCESMASLKKFVAIWMAMAPPKVQPASRRSQAPVSNHASTQATQTGTTAAGSVLGRAASKQACKGGVTAGSKTVVVEVEAMEFPRSSGGVLLGGPWL